MDLLRAQRETELFTIQQLNMKEIWRAIHRAFCAMFHGDCFELALDLRAGIKKEDRMNVLFCGKCKVFICKVKPSTNFTVDEIT